MDMNLNNARLFAKVVDKGSFTAAGHALGLQVSTVSRRVARLETDLGTRLLHRTTRKLSLTDAGRTYYRMAVAGLEQMDAAAQAIRELQGELSGRIRFTSVPGMGKFAWELIKAFLADNPRVTIEMNLTERTADLVGGGYDLALRTGSLRDSSLISKHIANSYFALFAAPFYIENHQSIRSPDQLAAQNCLLYGTSLDNCSWTLSCEGQQIEVGVSGRLATTSLETHLHACREGFGIAHLPITMCQPSVEDGSLVRVLPEWAGSVFKVFVVYPSRKLVSPTVRAFIDFLAGEAEGSLRMAIGTIQAT